MSIPAQTLPLRSSAPAPAARPPARAQYVELKASVHRKLLNRVNLEALAKADRPRAESEIKTLVVELLGEEGTPISLGERETLFSELIDEVFGLGPLEPLLRDGTISDILVNTYKHVYVERGGVLERVNATFQDNRHLMRVIDRIVSGVGRRVDDSSPMVDARLADGSRVNAIIPPLAVDGPLLSIRRFPAERLKADDLVTLRALTRPMLEVLSHCVRARPNTGHDGSLTTVHANTPRDALSRIETMIAMGATNLPERAMRQQIAAAIQIVVQQTRLSDGTRKVTSVSEITGMEGDVITMQEIFRFEKLGLGQEGKVLGRFVATGVRPKVCERLRASGITLAPEMFDGQVEVRS